MKIKIARGKQRNTIAKQSQLSSLNSSMIKIQKLEVKQTQLQTNFTSQSWHLNATVKKNTKIKKVEIQSKQKKQKTIRQKELMTSGRKKTLKQKVKNKKSCDFQRQKYLQPINQGAVSHRQYCLVQDSFVPVTSASQHKMIQDILRSTADTTQQSQDLNRTTFRKTFPFKLKGKTSAISTKSQNQIQQNMFPKMKKISKRQVEAKACPFYEQIGIQYSERPQLKQIIKQKQTSKAVQIDIQTDEIIQIQSPAVKFIDPCSPRKQRKDETLSDLLLKLQFKHLPDQKSFEHLSKNQKQHYSQLLNSLIAKLNCSPRQMHKSPIKTKQKIQIQQVNLVPLQQIKIKHEKLEMEIFKRESQQMNWMQRRQLGGEQTQDYVDTSFMSVSSFLLNFFCFVQLNYLQEFLINIKKQFGPSYISQFRRLTRKNQPYNQKTQVLQISIFQQFCLQLHQITQFQRIHVRAIFDYINSLLDCYRPYFQHKGEPFPWAVKIYNNICQYVIDQSSLEIIFIEIKQTIQKSLSFLCGLIVDDQLFRDIQTKNPLSLKRDQRQNLFIESWLVQKTDQNRSIECQATTVLHEVSQQIYNMILLQIFSEKPFISVQ